MKSHYTKKSEKPINDDWKDKAILTAREKTIFLIINSKYRASIGCTKQIIVIKIKTKRKTYINNISALNNQDNLIAKKVHRVKT